MTTIGPLSPLLAQIQAQAATWRRQAQVGRASAPRPEARAEHEPLDLASHLAREVRAIPGDDPQRRRKAFRAYLHVVLARECAISRLDDPGLLELVTRVHDTMERDAALRSAMARAGEELLRSVG